MCAPFLREFCTPESDSMSPTEQLAFLMFTLLVLFSTLCPAGDHHEEIPPTKLSCLLRSQWNAVCIQQPPDLNEATPDRSVDTAYKVSLLFFILHCIGRKDVTGRALQLQHNYFDRLMQSTEEHDTSELSYLGEFVHV